MYLQVNLQSPQASCAASFMEVEAISYMQRGYYWYHLSHAQCFGSILQAHLGVSKTQLPLYFPSFRNPVVCLGWGKDLACYVDDGGP